MANDAVEKGDIDNISQELLSSFSCKACYLEFVSALTSVFCLRRPAAHVL